MKLSIIVCACISVLMLLSGCSWGAAHKKTIHPRIQCERNVGKQELECIFQECTGKELPDMISGIEGYGYKVLLMRLVNQGSTTYLFKPSYCKLHRAPWDQIAPLMHYDTSSRVTWLTIPALYLLWEAIPLLVVPYGFYWRACNRDISDWLQRVTLGPEDSLEIFPYEQVERYLFVPEERYTTHFKVSFFDTAAKELVSYSIEFKEK